MAAAGQQCEALQAQHAGVRAEIEVLGRERYKVGGWGRGMGGARCCSCGCWGEGQDGGEGPDAVLWGVYQDWVVRQVPLSV